MIRRMAILVVSAILPASSGQEYVVTPVSAYTFRIDAINERGDAVLRGAYSMSPATFGIYADGRFETVGYWLGVDGLASGTVAYYDRVYDINDSRDVVGSARYPVPGANAHRGFIYRFDSSTIEYLGTFGGRNSYAIGMNNAGVVVGTAQTWTEGYHAFVWHGDEMMDIHPGAYGCADGNCSAAIHVSDNGVVVGITEGLSVNEYAIFRYSLADATLEILEPPDGFNRVLPTAVDAVGDFVGFAWNHNVGFPRAVIYQAGQFQRIPEFPGTVISEAWDINDSGSVVGWWQDSQGFRHGFFYDADGVHAVTLPNFNYSELVAISNNDTIAGNDGGPPADGSFLLTKLADMNWDGLVDNFDIDAFTLALTNPAGYQAQYHHAPSEHGDCTRDGLLNNFDIDAFVECIVSGGCE